MHAELCQHMPGCGAVAWPAGPAAALLSTLNSVMHTVAHLRSIFRCPLTRCSRRCATSAP